MEQLNDMGDSTESVNKGVDSVNSTDNLTEPQVISDQPIDANMSEPVQQQIAPELEVTPPKKNFFKRLHLPKTKKGKIATILIGVAVVGLLIVAFLMYKSNKHPQNAVQHFNAVVLPFQVISTTPTLGQEGVSASTKVTIRFTRPVDPNKAKGDFFFSPDIAGTYQRGSDDKEVVFTPAIPFAQPSKISLMIHSEFMSTDGRTLGADYFMNFTTALPNNTVVFKNGDYYSQLTSVSSDVKQTYTILADDSTSQDSVVNVYKSDSATLLKANIYKKLSYDSAVAGTYKSAIPTIIDTSGMKLIQTKKGYKNNDQLDVQQKSGVYLIEATSKGKQVGVSWVTFSDYGVLVRQDDKKLIAVAKNIASGADETGSIELYNLENTVTKIGGGKLSGISEFTTAYDQGVDFVVANVNDQELVVPMAVLNTLADIRVNKDLSKQLTTYASTDRAVYEVGDSAKIAGFVRQDNDAIYNLANTGISHLTVRATNQSNGASVAEIDAKVDSHGVITAELPISSSMITAGSARTSFDVVDSNNQIITTFEVADKAKSVSLVLDAQFDKPSYLANETPKLTIKASKSDGSAYTNKTATVAWYSKDFIENNPAANERTDNTIGSQLYAAGNTSAPYSQTVTFDGTGKANLDAPISMLPAGVSSTISANVVIDNDTTNVSAVIHQGSYFVSFAPSKQVFNAGDQLSVRPVVRDLSGKVQTGVAIHAAFIVSSYDQQTSKNIDKIVAEADGVTSNDGMVELAKQPGDIKVGSQLSVLVSVADGSNNKIQARDYLYIRSPESAMVFSDLQLSNLDISGTNGELEVGKDTTINIRSDYDITTLVSYERGRIYHTESLHLKKGDNPYKISVSAELAPNFTLVFSYFKDGQYVNEGTVLEVSNPVKFGSLSITADKSLYSVNATANLTITTLDGLKSPVASRLVVKVLSDSSFSANQSIGRNIGSFFFANREITTNGSSSRTGLGSGGGRCGGGGFDIITPSTKIGGLEYYDTTMSTDTSGKLDFKVPLKTVGKWRIIVLSASDETVVSSSYQVVTVQ